MASVNVHIFFFDFTMSLLLLTGVSNKHCLLSLFSFLSDQVGSQNIGFLMTRLILLSAFLALYGLIMFLAKSFWKLTVTWLIGMLSIALEESSYLPTLF